MEIGKVKITYIACMECIYSIRKRESKEYKCKTKSI